MTSYCQSHVIWERTFIHSVTSFQLFPCKDGWGSAAQAGTHSPSCYDLSRGSLHEPWFSLCWRWFITAASDGIPSALCWQGLVPLPSRTLQTGSFSLETEKGQQNQLFAWHCMVCHDWDLLFFLLSCPFPFCQNNTFPPCLSICSF